MWWIIGSLIGTVFYKDSKPLYDPEKPSSKGAIIAGILFTLLCIAMSLFIYWLETSEN
jgi:hypothetical protein